jgi:hypothetical protein
MPDLAKDLVARNKLVNQVVALLASHEYEQLEIITCGHRLSAEEMRAAILEYGRTLISLPDDALGLINYIECQDLSGWSVVVPLFTREEGRSDLSLELSLVGKGLDDYDVQIDDIHVL